MDTIRLGKRTDDRVPLIRDFVPLAALDDIVFGAWDPFPDDAYVAAQRAGVLEARPAHRADLRRAARRAPDAGRLRPHVREAHRRRQRQGVASTSGRCSRRSARTSTASATRSRSTGVVMIWCGVDRDLHRAGPGAHRPRGVRGGDRRQRPDDRPVDALRLRRAPRGRAVRQRRAEPHRRHPRAARARHRAQRRRSPARTSRPARR